MSREAQKRHVILIGEPGTGKSMLAQSMTDFIPKEGRPIAKEMLQEVREGVSEFGKITTASVAYEEDQESIIYFNNKTLN